MLPVSHLNTSERPVASNGSCDVYEGRFDGSKVCVKRLRVYSMEGPTDVKRVCYQGYCVHLLASDETYRHSAMRPYCGNG